jgi:Flp pilus assembly protein CpaB
MPTLSRNIIISIVLAIAAAAAILAYTSHVRDTADRAASTVRVVVATHEIPSGTPADDARAKGWLELRAVRQSEVASGAFTSLDATSGKVITQALYDGDQLTPFRLGAAGKQTAAGQVTGEFRAIRVPFNPNSGLLRDLQVGDHVDILTSYRKGDATYTYLAVPNALVISVDAPATGGSAFSNASGGNGSVLLSVTEQQALIIAGALASSSGTSNNIWLAAVGRSGATYAPIQPVHLPGKFPDHGIPAK